MNLGISYLFFYIRITWEKQSFSESISIEGGIISFEQLGSCRAAGSYGKTFSKTAELANAPFVAPVNLITVDEILFKAEKSIERVTIQTKYSPHQSLSNQKSCPGRT